MFTLTIDTRNAAFAHDDHDTLGPEPELARILRLAAARVESGSWTGALKDYNGNTVGRFELTDESEAR